MFLICFFLAYTIVKQTPVLVFHTTQNTSYEISTKCFYIGLDNVMPMYRNQASNLKIINLALLTLNFFPIKQSFFYKIKITIHCPPKPLFEKVQL